MFNTVSEVWTITRIFAFVSALLCNLYAVPVVAQSAVKPGGLTTSSVHVRWMKVTRVVDGDTFWADDGTPKGLKVRLTGIDAPESRKSFKKEVGYFGIESKAYLTKLLHNQQVRLVTDIRPKDRYGRTLAYVYLSDGSFVNALMVQQGYAITLTMPPNVKHAALFARLQAEAREHKRGLWAGRHGL